MDRRLFDGFALTAVLLAVIGLYGLVSYAESMACATRGIARKVVLMNISAERPLI